jgi:phosphate transport system substrate-binding protein
MKFRPAITVYRASLLSVTAAALAGCTIRDADVSVHGIVRIDGSSTVYPITQAVAEEFLRSHPHLAAPVAKAGTGGGFKRFTADDLDVCNASRPIEPEEIAACATNGVEYLEFEIAMDGLSVVVNRNNTWCDALTIDQLRTLWVSGSRVKSWRDLDPSFPDQEIVLYGPDTDSGTFDYFTEVVCGKRGKSRSDYTPSSDDNVLIQGVEGDRGALGYFGYAYYALNKDALKLVRIAPGSNVRTAIAPTEETILNGTYRPLSRPLLLYVNKKSLERPEVAAFMSFYFEKAPPLISEVHYIPLPARQYQLAAMKLQKVLESIRGPNVGNIKHSVIP